MIARVQAHSNLSLCMLQWNVLVRICNRVSCHWWKVSTKGQL
jgi:hypothetical protein